MTIRYQLLAWLPLVTLTAFGWRTPPIAEKPDWHSLGISVVEGRAYRTAGSRALKLDVYTPESAVKSSDRTRLRPALIAIHGGSWIGGSRGAMGDDSSDVVVRLAQQGLVLFAIDYTLARPGEPSWPAVVGDLREAVRWVRRHSGEFGVDPARIGVIGQSSGGHLAALLGTLPEERGPDGVSSRVQAVVSFYAPFDLAGLIRSRRLTHEPARVFLGNRAPEAADPVTEASPLEHVTPDDSPMLLIHGSDDDWVPVNQANRMASALSTAGVAHRLIVVDGARHGFETLFKRPASLDLLPEILAFLENAWNISPVPVSANSSSFGGFVREGQSPPQSSDRLSDSHDWQPFEQVERAPPCALDMLSKIQHTTSIRRERKHLGGAPLNTTRGRRFRPERVTSLEERAMLSAAPVLEATSGNVVAQSDSTHATGPGGWTEMRNVAFPTVDGQLELLDVYLPRTPAPAGGRPVIVAIHGGGWRRFSKTGYGLRVAAGFVRDGYAVVAPDYALSSPDNPTWPLNFEDVQAAVRWVRANAGALDINPNEIVAMGESAGANLAALLGVYSTQNVGGGVSAAVDAVIAASTPTDLTALDSESSLAGYAVAQFLGGSPEQVPANYIAASPIDHVSAGDPPMLLIQGRQDPLIPVSQSEDMVAALTAAGVRNQLILVNGNHDLDFPPHYASLIPEVLAFLNATWSSAQSSASVADARTDQSPAPAQAQWTEEQNVSFPTVDGQSELLDVYTPVTPPPAGGYPVMVAIHGGGWRSSDKSSFGLRTADGFTPDGYVVVAPDYVLSTPTDPTWPLNFEDVQAAVRWVRGHAAALDINPDEIVAEGESAGANLAALLGVYSPQDTAGSVSAAVDAVVAVSTPANLTTLYHEKRYAGTAAAQFLGGSPRQVPANYTAASPVDHVAHGDPPMLLIHGRQDGVIPVSQSREMQFALTSAGVKNDLIVVNGGHGLDFPAEYSYLVPDVLEFLTTTWKDKGTLSS